MSEPTENIVEETSQEPRLEPRLEPPKPAEIPYERLLMVHDDIVGLVKKFHGDSPKTVSAILPRDRNSQVVFMRGKKEVARADLHVHNIPRTGTGSNEPLLFPCYYTNVTLEPAVVKYVQKTSK